MAGVLILSLISNNFEIKN